MSDCTGVDIHTEEAEGPKLRVDYFDTKKQVREYVKREAAAAKAVKEKEKRNRKKKDGELGPLDASAEPA
eukprot:COSAG02_NODE_2460_length_8797_cov_6.129915_8_plen_70_part_00